MIFIQSWVCVYSLECLYASFLWTTFYIQDGMVPKWQDEYFIHHVVHVPCVAVVGGGGDIFGCLSIVNKYTV